MATRNQKAKKDNRPFAMVYRVMGQSAAYRSLSFVAQGVLMQLHLQYNGKNNGDLSATATMALEWGIRSDNTLRKALKELESGGWIINTRLSRFDKHVPQCNLWALSWYAIDECPGKKLDVGPTRAPPRTISSLVNSISSVAKSADVRPQ
ncbi:helix-turn-helix domain-containing protein [Pseudomonas viridiflava]|uniref:helix-turn-helix domain-containing protein n=1 Tax=Pseudomonas viridiflava TaxID=33069 RepID=UPI001F11D33B|nr:helix-turn-helix domain-containing protein [Pseudomonas viridiflava]